MAGGERPRCARKRTTSASNAHSALETIFRHTSATNANTCQNCSVFESKHSKTIHVHNQRCQNHAPDDFYWSTSNDNYTDAQWTPSLIGNWLSEIQTILNIQSPAGVSWSGHSLRSKDITTTAGCAHMLLSIVTHARERF